MEEAERVVAAEAELAAQTDEFVAFETQRMDHLARLRDEDKAAYDWERFSACCAPGSKRGEGVARVRDERARERPDVAGRRAADVAEDHELIIREAELYRDWALAEGHTDEATMLAACGERVER